MTELNSAGLDANAARELRNRYEAVMAELNSALRAQKRDPMNPLKQQEVDRCKRAVDEVESAVRKAAW